MDSTCQACKEFPVEVIEETDDPNEPYKLCTGCHHRLMAFSLRPIEWYNLASVHSFYKYHLHDDFYDENGTASQPNETVLDAVRHPSPTLEAVANSPDELLSYAFTRWQIQDDLISVMKKYSPNVWLQIVGARLKETKSQAIIDTVFLICGKLLGESAGTLVRTGWEDFRYVAFPGLSYALAKCLPREEGYAKVTDALSQMNDQERCENMYVLSWFETPLTLDWIEENIKTFSDSWGYLAASSKLDWQRATKWLHTGRPLSLVALDALRSCVRYDTPIHKEQRPRLMNPPDKAECIETLEAYRMRDDVPRVARRVSFLLANIDRLLKGA
jgi:hypothetical protein